MAQPCVLSPVPSGRQREFAGTGSKVWTRFELSPPNWRCDRTQDVDCSQSDPRERRPVSMVGTQVGRVSNSSEGSEPPVEPSECAGEH